MGASALINLATDKHRYHGYSATQYEAQRTNQLAWAREYAVIKQLCKKFPPSSRVLDIPCGTGRLFPLFNDHGHQIWGADISADMLKEVPSSRLQLPGVRDVARCDAEFLPFADEAFDYVVSLRFFHLGISVEAGYSVLREFARVAKKGLVLHSPLQKQTPLGICADATAEVLFSRTRAPVELIAQIKKARTIIGNHLPGLPGSSAKSVPESNSTTTPAAFSCTIPELESVVGEAGFTVVKSYGAISPFSSKRIYLLEKGEPGSV